MRASIFTYIQAEAILSKKFYLPDREKLHPSAKFGALQLNIIFFVSKNTEVILPCPHFQETVQPSYILDAPYPDLKSLYPPSE